MFVRHLLILLTAASIAPADAMCAPPTRVDIVARLYNTARVPDAIRDGAITGATQAFAGSGINVTWRKCDVADACSLAPAAGEFVIRLVRSHEASNPDRALVLGEASIDRGAGAGVLGTVYVNRVALMAERSGTDAAVLLGRAIAHELGHLLLATTAHSSSGLMRAQWTPREIRADQIGDWMLSNADAEAIRRRAVRDLTAKHAKSAKNAKKDS